MLLWLPVLFGCGIALYFGLKAEPWAGYGIGAVAAALPFCVATFRKNGRWRPVWLVALGLLRRQKIVTMPGDGTVRLARKQLPPRQIEEIMQAYGDKRDADRLFCFESAASGGMQPILKRGMSLQVADTPFDEGGGSGSLVVPLRGKRGQAMGFIGLAGAQPQVLPTPAELGGIIESMLYPSESAAA